MELVNNRYRIIKNLKQNRIVSSYLVSDMMDNYREIVLNILNSEFLPDTIIDYYSKEFLSLSTLNNGNIIKNFDFNIVSYIDNKKPHNVLYFYTSEYKENVYDIFEISEGKNVLEKLDLFIQLCNGINYLHLKGILYGELNLNNIIITEEYNGLTLRLKDIASVELEKYNFKLEKSEEMFFRNPRMNIGEPAAREHDIYALGLILVLLISGRAALKGDVWQELQNIEAIINDGNKTDEDSIILRKLYPLLEKLLCRHGDYPYAFLKDFLKELNHTMGTEYKIFRLQELEKLTFKIKLIDREEELDIILKSYEYMMKYKPVKKFFLIHGESGTGKTRLLEEIKFQLNLKNASIYSSFSLSNLSDSSNKMWIELLRKLIVEGDPETIDKYEVELMKFFPELLERKNMIQAEVLSRDSAKYRLLNRIAGFISESIKNKPAVFIIDNIHLSNEFTIDTFAYLFNEIVKNKNIMMIFSYKDREVLNNKKLRDFIHRMHESSESVDINLRDLSHEETALMVKYMLTMPSTPYKVAKRIYAKSYGNPLFINEIMKNLFNRKNIYINENGIWDSNYNAETYDYMPIPNSLEQALLNQIKDSDNIGHEILKTISVFSNSVSIEDIGKMIQLDTKEIEKAVDELVFKGIICRKIGDKSYVYDINNKVLKDIVYSKIDDSEKMEKHRVASEILEIEYDSILGGNIDELIYHLEQAGISDKVKKYCIESADRMEALKNRSIEIKYLEKALSMIKDEGNIEKIELMLKIGNLYFDDGDVTKALNCFIRCELLAKTVKDKRYSIRAYVNIATTYNARNERKSAARYINKIKGALEGLDYLEGYLECKRLEAIVCMNEQKYSEVELLVENIIKLSADGYDRIKGEVYRTLGVVNLHRGTIQEAIDCFNNAMKFSEKANRTPAMLIALNNIGVIYADYYQDYDVALEYFNKIKDISEENNYQSSEMLAFTNIAEMYYAKMDYKLAYDYNLLALEKAIKLDSEDTIFYCYNQLTKTLLQLDNYREAYHYHQLSDKELENFPDQGRDISEYFRSSSELFYKLGELSISEKYAKKAIKIYGSEESAINLHSLAHIQYINLRCKDIRKLPIYINKLLDISQKFVSPENRIKLLSAGAVILYENKQSELAAKLIKEASKSAIGPITDLVNASHLLALGLLGRDDQKLNHLLSALEIAKKIKKRELIISISIAIGDYYFHQKNYFYSANYYIEACEIIRELVNQIPDEYKLKFVNCNNMVKPFKRIEYIRNRYIDGKATDEDETSEPIKSYVIYSPKELTKLLVSDDTKGFLVNREFIYSIRKLYMSFLPKGIHNEKDLLTNLGTDNIKNVEMVIKYLAGITLATGGYIAIEGSHGNLKTIVSINDNFIPTNNRHIFERAKATMEPVLILQKNLEQENDLNLLTDEIKACLCVPISSRSYLDESLIENDLRRQTNFKATISGYLYLESDRILNNFNSNGLQKCIELSGFLNLLLEKHQLKLTASIDKLTGALTRKYLEEALTEQVEKAEYENKNFSIIMYDLDRFKSVNDRFGHQTGDDVLKKVSKIVRNNIGRNDIFGRYGGEEFIIILTDTDYEDAALVAEELRKNIQDEKILGDKAEVTVSMGISAYPIHGSWKQELVEKADQALYIAKENGRNRCQIWDSKFSKKVQGTNKLNGIISGNAVQDSRNVLVLVELIQLISKNISKQEKIHSLLGRVIEIFEAQFGMLIIVEDSKIVKNYGRKALSEDWLESMDYNEASIQKVIRNNQGLYMIDWDYVGTHDLLTNIPDWYSILVVPVMVNNIIKGILYLSVSTRVKEFGFNEFNFLSVISDLAANIL